MAQYNFKGDIDGINEGQLKFINSVILKQGLTNCNVTFTPVDDAADTFVKRIIIEGKNGKLTIIAKIAPSNEIIRKSMGTFESYKNEHIMYSEVVPKFNKLQKEAGIPEEEQIKFAKCYGSTAEQLNEVILLEDLNQLNFTMLDRFQPLSNDCVKSVLKNLAILHSLSYVLKQKEPETYNGFKANLTDTWSLYADTEEAKIFLQATEDDALSVLENPDHILFVKHKVVKCIEEWVKLAKSDENKKYNVIVQGDAWTNNIMFKYKNQNLSECIMIDYQLSRSISPVYDIMYMFFNCTDHESRNKHYNDWINYYHSELNKSLSDYNLKADNVYPRDQLDADLKRYAFYMFGVSVIMASFQTRKTDDAAKVIEAMKIENPTQQVQELGVTQLDEDTRIRFKNRVIGLINTYTEFGLL